MNTKSSITLEIMDKKFKVNCDADEKTKVIDSAELVNFKISEIKKHGKSIGIDRIAIMTALNIANDFIEQKDTLSQSGTNQEQKISDLANRIDNTLQELK